jgi:hypothetical protein
MRALKIEVPVCGWIAIRSRSAREMVSVWHVVLSILRVTVIEIKDVDHESGHPRLAPETCPPPHMGDYQGSRRRLSPNPERQQRNRTAPAKTAPR